MKNFFTLQVFYIVATKPDLINASNNQIFFSEKDAKNYCNKLNQEAAASGNVFKVYAVYVEKIELIC